MQLLCCCCELLELWTERLRTTLGTTAVVAGTKGSRRDVYTLHEDIRTPPHPRWEYHTQLSK